MRLIEHVKALALALALPLTGCVHNTKIVHNMWHVVEEKPRVSDVLVDDVNEQIVVRYKVAVVQRTTPRSFSQWRKGNMGETKTEARRELVIRYDQLGAFRECKVESFTASEAGVIQGRFLGIVSDPPSKGDAQEQADETSYLVKPDHPWDLDLRRVPLHESARALELSDRGASDELAAMVTKGVAVVWRTCVFFPFAGTVYAIRLPEREGDPPWSTSKRDPLNPCAVVCDVVNGTPWFVVAVAAAPLQLLVFYSWIAIDYLSS